MDREKRGPGRDEYQTIDSGLRKAQRSEPGYARLFIVIIIIIIIISYYYYYYYYYQLSNLRYLVSAVYTPRGLGGFDMSLPAAQKEL